MAVTLEYFDKCIEINGKGIPKSRIRYKFTGDTLKIWDDAKGEFNPEIEGLAYGQITNNNALPAPAPFAALADLKSYIRDNFFFDVNAAIGEPGTNINLIKSVDIVATSNTITDADIDNDDYLKDVTVISIFRGTQGENGGLWYHAGFMQNLLTGEIDATAIGGFTNGEFIILLGKVQ